MEDYEIAPDNLHNGKGVAKQSLDAERNKKGWNELIFLRNLAKHIGRSATSQMKGSDWRLLVVLHQEIVIPAISDPDRRLHVTQFYKTLSEIQWISYAEPSVRKNRGIRLRLHAQCFFFAFWTGTIFVATHN